MQVKRDAIYLVKEYAAEPGYLTFSDVLMLCASNPNVLTDKEIALSFQLLDEVEWPLQGHVGRERCDFEGGVPDGAAGRRAGQEQPVVRG